MGFNNHHKKQAFAPKFIRKAKFLERFYDIIDIVLQSTENTTKKLNMFGGGSSKESRIAKKN